MYQYPTSITPLLDSRSIYTPELRQEGMGLAFIPIIAMAVASAISTGGTIVAGQKRNNSQLKVMATTATDEVERNLAANRDWFLSLPNPTLSEKQAVVDFFNQQWGAWVQAMTGLGEPGQRAVRERQRDGVNSWGSDWWELYLDPILAKKVVEELPSQAPTQVQIENVGGLDMKKVSILLLAGGVAWWVMGGSK